MAETEKVINIQQACSCFCKVCEYKKERCKTDWKCAAYIEFRDACRQTKTDGDTKYYFASFTGTVAGVRKFGSACMESTFEHGTFPAKQFVEDMEKEYHTDPNTLVVLHYKQISKMEYESCKNIYG